MGPIERDVPIPSARMYTNTLYRFHELQPGDSRYYTDHARLVSTAVRQFMKRHPEYQLEWRREGSGVRVWRLETEKETSDE